MPDEITLDEGPEYPLTADSQTLDEVSALFFVMIRNLRSFRITNMSLQIKKHIVITTKSTFDYNQNILID